MKRRLSEALVFVLLACVSASAQQTTGTIGGRVLNQQGAAIPGVTVTARNPSDRLHAHASRAKPRACTGWRAAGRHATNDGRSSGFSTIDRKDVVVNVGQTITLDFALRWRASPKPSTSPAQSPLIETTSSSVGGVVDIRRIESMPLNGRQFANLAATIPGVGLGFHSDPTKSTQYSPQINGGNGRNVNYQIDGGDNNDDTVGGLLQLFPLEAIQEFNFRPRATRRRTAAATAAS